MNTKEFEELCNKLSTYLIIDKNALEIDNVNFTQQLDEISQAHLDIQDRVDEIKYLLKNEYATLDLSLRDELEKTNVKVTESKIQSLILCSSSYASLSSELLNLQKQEVRLRSIKEAMFQKGARLDNLCKLYSSGYFEKEKVKRSDRKMYETEFEKKITLNDEVKNTTELSTILHNLKKEV